jgi:Immunoglobulin I-set domain
VHAQNAGLGYIQENRMTNYSFISTLQIPSLNTSHTGRYSCVAEKNGGNVFEDQSKLVRVMNVVKPHFTNTNLNNAEKTFSRDTNHQLECRVDGMPRPKVTWFKDSMPFTPNDTRIGLLNKNQTLYLHYLGMDDDGQYKCKATNAGGTIEAHIDLRVRGMHFDSECYNNLFCKPITLKIAFWWEKGELNENPVPFKSGFI